MSKINIVFKNMGEQVFLKTEFKRLANIVFTAEFQAQAKFEMDKSLLQEIRISSLGDKVKISGGDLSSLVAGMYSFFENCGVHFGFSGEIVHEKKPLNALPEIEYSHTPSVKNRGIRMHLNFVQDQSFFTEPDFKSFIDNIVSMKMNYLMFHMYNGQEWFPFTYKGLKHLDLELGNLNKKPLPADMIGREKIKTKNFWYPKEFEDITDAEELMNAVWQRYLAMMTYAKERGVKLSASIEPEVVSDEFETLILSLSNTDDEIVKKEYNLKNDWQEGWSGKKIIEVDTRNPILKDIAIERVLQMHKAYPLLDEIQLISREGTNYQADSEEEYLAELKRLEKSLGIVFDKDLPEQLREIAAHDGGAYNPKAYPYWTVLPGDNYYSSFVGAMRYFEFVREVLADERLQGIRDKGIEMVVGLYSPNPEAIRRICRYAGKALPKEIAARFDILGDYGARDICNQMDSWQPTIDMKNGDVGLISWLEFDGTMSLGQSWTESIYDNVKKACDMGLDTVYFNHWRVRSLEQNAKVAAASCFDVSRGYDCIISEYTEDLYGKASVKFARRVYDLFEQATIFCKQHHYNIGFTNDWVYVHATDTPGYAWENLKKLTGMYEDLAHDFDTLCAMSKSQGAETAEYFRDICKISALHLMMVYHLQSAKLPLVGYACWPIDAKSNWPAMEIMKEVLYNSRLALEYAYQYMRVYAPHVVTSDEQGCLAHHQSGAVEALEGHLRRMEEVFDKAVRDYVSEPTN